MSRSTTVGTPKNFAGSVGLRFGFGELGFGEQAFDLGFGGRTHAAGGVIRIGNEASHHGDAFDQFGDGLKEQENKSNQDAAIMKLGVDLAGKPPAFIDCSLSSTDFVTNG